jgi:glycosyltransferase involved in cell wall biosynthesis
MPSIHHRLTGGSLFNRKILDCIQKTAAVDLHIEGEAVDRQPEAGIWLVDSLCLHSGAAHLRRCPGATGIVIAHYLKLLDCPGVNPDPQQADAEFESLRAYKAVITTSQFARKTIIESGFRGRVETVRPGLPASYRRSVANRPSGSCRILTVASLFRDKGLMEMVSILETLETLEDSNWSWEIVGDDELDAGFAGDLRRRLSESPIRKRVCVRGALPPDQVEAAYNGADVFALPSRFETCSMVTMEAMARGLPVAAFRVGGIPELLPDRSGRQLADAGDWRRFAAILGSLIGDHQLRLALGEENRLASEQFPSWEDAGAIVLDLIKEFASFA